MKRDIREVYEILNKKLENAQEDVLYERNRKYPSNKKLLKLQGEIEAYQDAIILIKTSGLV